MRRYLCHDSLPVRAFSLFGIGLALFLFSWTIGYLYLPEGILRGRTAAAVLGGEAAAASVAAEFLRIAGINLGIATLFVILPNRLLTVGGYPLGYLPPLGWCVLYGVTLGTNSFAIPLVAPMAPSLAVVGRSGLYEIAAYCLAAASTHAVAVARSPGLFSFESEPIHPRPPFWRAVHRPGLGAALALLLAANAWEAYRIVQLYS